MVTQEMYNELVYKGHGTRWPFVDSVVSDKLTNYAYAAYRPPKTDLLNHRFPKYGDVEMGKYHINLLPGQFKRGGGYPPSYYQCINHREVKRNYQCINQWLVCKFTLEKYIFVHVQKVYL